MNAQATHTDHTIINGHIFTDTVKTARQLIGNITSGEIDLYPPYQRAGSCENYYPNLLSSWLTEESVPDIILNDRAPDGSDGAIQEADTGRYGVIAGRHVLEAATAWFAGRLYVPATWFPTGCVARTGNHDTMDGRNLPHTCMPWLTDAGQALVEQRATLWVSIGAVDDEEDLFNNLPAEANGRGM